MNLRLADRFSLVGIVSTFATVGLLILISGCRTPKIDWNARVGVYTYDQAVLDFGPPDKQAQLDDGVVVAEWLTQRGYSQAYVVPVLYPGYCGPYYAPAYGSIVDTSSPSTYLRLIFSSDHKLQGWKTFYK